MSLESMDISSRFSLNTLEYSVIIAKLAGCTQSSLGHELAENLKPSTDPSEVASRLDVTDDARRFFDRERSIPTFQGLHDIRDGLARAEKGGILNPGELWLIDVTIKS